VVESVIPKDFKFIETGTVDWSTLRLKFADLEQALNEHALEIKALARRQTQTVSRIFETRGTFPLLEPGRHLRSEVTGAYAIVHDNVEEEILVGLPGLATGPVKFSASEKKGSAKEFTLPMGRTLLFTEGVKVSLSANRRVSVYLTLESREES